MWGSDFPHPEGTWPHTKQWLQRAFHDIPIDETRAMLGGNAAELYQFDVDALTPLADQIGPSPEALHQTGDEQAKWEPLKQAGRPWLTELDAMPIPTGS